MADELEIKLAKDQWLGGQQPSAADREAIEAFTSVPSASTHPNVFAWYCMVSKFTPTVRAQWAGAAAPKAAAAKAAPAKKDEPKQEDKKAEAEDDFDPFADDEPEDEEVEKARMERMKALAKPAKQGLIAKSLVIWEVKPWGEETDLDALGKKICGIEMDGLTWKTEFKKEPIAYGVFKIIIGAVVEDAKVSTDIVEEKIMEFEDEVQSVDIQSFNKL